MRDLWYHLWRVILHVLFSLAFKIRMTGKENIPKTGPVLIVSNHQSFLDPPLCGMAIPRVCDYMARATLFDIPILSWFIRSVNSIPVSGGKNGRSDIKTFKALINRLKNNRMVIIYPEGSRTLDGEVHDFQSGFELIARKSGATIVPMAMDGAHNAMPRGTGGINFGQKIQIMYGQPISPDLLKSMTRDEFVAEVKNRITKMHAHLRNSLT